MCSGCASRLSNPSKDSNFWASLPWLVGAHHSTLDLVRAPSQPSTPATCGRSRSCSQRSAELLPPRAPSHIFGSKSQPSELIALQSDPWAHCHRQVDHPHVCYPDPSVVQLLANVARLAPKQHVTLRLRTAIKHALTRQANKEGLSRTGLAERYLEEAIRMAEHPGVIFRAGPAGRRAAVVGGPDVWEVVETFLAEGRDVDATARYLNLPLGLVRSAIDYYADNREEVDEWIRRNRLLADEAEAATVRRRRVTSG